MINNLALKNKTMIDEKINNNNPRWVQKKEENNNNLFEHRESLQQNQQKTFIHLENMVMQG